MSFEEKFPSLKKLFYWLVSTTDINDGIPLKKSVVNTSDVEDFCLDKSFVIQQIKEIHLLKDQYLTECYDEDCKWCELLERFTVQVRLNEVDKGNVISSKQLRKGLQK